MAKVNNLATQGAKGKAGNLIYSSAFGIDYFKGQAATVNQPNTLPQQAQKKAMALCTATSQLLGSWYNMAYKHLAVKMSAYNAFSKKNLDKSKMQLDNDGIPTAYGVGGIYVPLMATQTGELSATVAGDQVTYDLAGLPPSANYEYALFAQLADGTIVQSKNGFANGTPAGTLAISVSWQGVAGGDVAWVAISLFNTSTKKTGNYGYKL